MAKGFAELLDEKPVFVNIGVRGFADSLRDAGFDVVDVNWSLPRAGIRSLSRFWMD